MHHLLARPPPFCPGVDTTREFCRDPGSKLHSSRTHPTPPPAPPVCPRADTIREFRRDHLSELQQLAQISGSSLGYGAPGGGGSSGGGSSGGGKEGASGEVGAAEGGNGDGAALAARPVQPQAA